MSRFWRVAAVVTLVTASLGVIAASAIASGTLYVTNNVTTNKAAAIPIPLSTLMPGPGAQTFANPIAIAISPDGGHAFVANDGNTPSVTIIDTAQNTPFGDIDPPNLTSPGSVAVSPDGSQVYVGNVNNNTVSILDPHTLHASEISVGGDPAGIAFTPDGRFAYVVNEASGTISLIDTSSHTVTTPTHLHATDLPTAPCALSVTPDGLKIVVIGGCGVGNGGVGFIDTATNTATTVPSDTDAYVAEAMAPDGTKAYVYDQTTGAIQVVDPRAGTLAATPLAGPGMAGIEGLAVSPDGKSLYATASLATGVDKIDIATGTVTPITIGPPAVTPWADAITPDQAPHAAFSVTPPTAGTASTFDASATTTFDGGAATYAWNFGDGSSATTTTPSTSHVYSQPGAYTATLTVTDDQNCSTEFVFTGQTASCNGGPAARASQSVTVPSSPPPTRTLTVAVSGNGTVTGSGIDCPGNCSATYADGTAVNLSAATGPGSVFTGFGGDCSGTGACDLTMSADRSVTAAFATLPGPPNTKIKKAKVNRKKRKATFKFKAIGAATGFQCELKRKHSRKKPRFRRCKSPKAYKHLKKGRYVFKVRALSSAGLDPSPARKKFRLK